MIVWIVVLGGPRYANSAVAVLPITIAPAANNKSTISAFCE
ncbi:MAG: hypothetical protein CM1200mP13_02960 [Candidatus Pelagibacterales bacterium]|nr:MAG: hypothetical protein CM1200mP13_02960 [Pelagibacterales bacterium]